MFFHWWIFSFLSGKRRDNAATGMLSLPYELFPVRYSPAIPSFYTAQSEISRTKQKLNVFRLHLQSLQSLDQLIPADISWSRFYLGYSLFRELNAAGISQLP